ncbi:MAG TPA: tRNA (adenosine(37)-N6)-threonylcarbamoyltransferase complex dimerization subunit type 1 TsaB [Candidatus Angelobacter sp.]
MLFLSIDTSGKSGGITLAEGAADSFQIIESAPIVGGTFSAQLVPALASLLRKNGFAAGDLRAFVAVSGPGSFTGLRVGLSAIKGLAEVLRQPIATVSVLETLAISSGPQGRVIAALDAGREEIFFGLYNISAGRAATLCEKLLSRPEFAHAIKDANAQRIVTSDPLIAELVRTAGLSAVEVDRPGSADAAQIGLRKLLAGETVGVEELDANYIRRSDAEIFSKPESSR